MPTIYLFREGSEDEGPLRSALDKLSDCDCQTRIIQADVAADLADVPAEAVVLTCLRDDTMADVVSLAAERRSQRGEVRTDLILKPLPYLRHAATEDFKDLDTVLRENAKTSPSFLMLMLPSALLAALGLYANSGPVIIGAVILAPRRIRSPRRVGRDRCGYARRPLSVDQLPTHRTRRLRCRVPSDPPAARQAGQGGIHPGPPRAVESRARVCADADDCYDRGMDLNGQWFASFFREQ